jgi:hypothetical protein
VALPIYRAVSFDRIIDKGGRTRPWSVIVDTGRELQPFVVKMFNYGDVLKRDPVTNEVLGNVLAQQFDLPVSPAAFIDFPSDFERHLKDPMAFEAFQQIDDRMKFGTRMITGNYLFEPALKKSQVARMIDIECLFAFDQLIRNVDRTNGKPNLLIKGKSAFLIDHELAFDIQPDTFDKLTTVGIENDIFKHHIFWRYLKKSHKITKDQFFDSFQEYLKYMNINDLRPFFKQLTSLDYDNARHNQIFDYLDAAKRNSSKFVSLLKLMTW